MPLAAQLLGPTALHRLVHWVVDAALLRVRVRVRVRVRGRGSRRSPA